MNIEVYPCIICKDGDPYSNIVCDNCESRIDHMNEVHESMIALVHDINNVTGYVPTELSESIKNLVYPLYQQLIKIKVENVTH